MRMSTRIAGIPCTVSGTAVDDWIVCDLYGRPAPWLWRKMTEADRERICIAFDEALRSEADDHAYERFKDRELMR